MLFVLIAAGVCLEVLLTSSLYQSCHCSRFLSWPKPNEATKFRHEKPLMRQAVGPVGT